MEDTGITPMDNDIILDELKDMDTTDNLRVMAIDPGTDNIAAIVNNFGEKPFVIKGGIIKSVNQLYNKELARLSSAAMLCNGRYRTKRMNELTGRRNRRIKDQFHKISRQIADYDEVKPCLCSGKLKVFIFLDSAYLICKDRSLKTIFLNILGKSRTAGKGRSISFIDL